MTHGKKPKKQGLKIQSQIIRSPEKFLNPNTEIRKHEHHLPHWQQGDIFYFVTFRLKDALPVARLKQWQMERSIWLKRNPKPWDEIRRTEYYKRFFEPMEKWLDSGMGSCLLKNRKFAQMVVDALMYFDKDRYDMSAYVIMPTHVHALFSLKGSSRLEKVIQGWKGFSARNINKALGAQGGVWHGGYWDRMIRNPNHFFKCFEYIQNNPVKARLRVEEFLLYEGE